MIQASDRCPRHDFMPDRRAIADASYERPIARSCLNCGDSAMCEEWWDEDDGSPCWTPRGQPRTWTFHAATPDRAYVAALLGAGLSCRARLFKLSDTNYSGKGRG